MIYTFSSLSFADFEDLSRDLIGRRLGVRFEAFCQGADGGIDGRHAKGEDTTILQAKHYHRSGFSTLLSAIKREYLKNNQLSPARYVLTTSRALSPHNKDQGNRI